MRTSRTACVIGIVAVLLACGTASAQQFSSWAGASDTDWSDATNWSPAAPNANDVGVFGSSSAYPNQPSLSSPSAIGGLWGTGSAPVTISGNPLTLNSATINSNAAVGIEMDAGAGSMAIGAPLALGAAQSWLNYSGNPLTVSGNVDNGGNLLTVAGDNVTISGNLSDAGGLTMNGPGTLVLTGNNSYTGDTNVNSGTLVAANPVFGIGAMAGNLYINSGGTVVVTQHDALFGPPNPTITNTANISAGGLLTSAGAVCDIGPIVLSGGTLGGTGDSNWGSWWLNGGGTATGGVVSTMSAALMTLPQTQTFFVDSGSTLNVTGTFIPTVNPNTGGITKTGPGMMILANYNSYTGDTTVNGGTLELAVQWSTLGASNLTINNGGTVYVPQQDGLWAGPAAASMQTLTVNAGGLLTIGSAPNDLGPVVLTGGTLAGAGDPSYGSYWLNSGCTATGGAVSTLSSLGMTMSLTQTFFVDSGSTLNVTGSFIPTPYLNAGGIIKTGPGMMILANPNSYIGGTTLDSGVLQVASINGLSSGTVTVNGGTLDLEGQYGSLGGNLTINNGGTVYVGQYDGLYAQGNLKTVTIGAGGLMTVYANPSTVRIATCDLGPLVLTGGTLDGAGDSDWGSWWLEGLVTATGSAVSTLNSAAMTLPQTQTFFVDSGSTLNVTGNLIPTPGANNTGGIIKTGPGTMVLSGSNTYTGTTTVNDGVLVVQYPDSLLDGSNVSVGDPTLLQLFGGAISAEASGATAASPVPEPGTLALLVVAGAVLLYRWRR